MRSTIRSARTAAVCVVAGSALLHAQLTLNPSPSRVIGQDWVVAKSSAPNLVEGREFNGPHGVAIDTRATPPILYVSDTGNNRVLAWRDISKAREGVVADLVIGQRDKFSTTAWGPGTSFTSGLTMPTGLAVDAQGNLYVVDTANNRILRFPRPFEQPDDVRTPDLVIGQTSLTTNAPNLGGVSASTIAVYVNKKLYRTAVAFDSQGNLYFTDAGNNRVLRYPYTALGAGAPNGPDANIVLGQLDFITNTAPRTDSQSLPQSLLDKNALLSPGGLTLSPTSPSSPGRLFVSDALNRVLVYPLPSYLGQAASRIMGLLSSPPATPVNDTQFYAPEGIVLIGEAPAVCDSGNNRILIFDPVKDWPLETPTEISPKAKSVIGQRFMADRKANAGSSGLSLPVHAAFYNNELYVADSGNNRVIVFPQQSSSPPTFATASRVVGQLGMDFNTVNLIEGKELYLGGVGGVAVDARSDPPRLYVADPGNHRILGYRDVRRVRTGDKADLVIGQQDLYRSIANYPYNDATLRNDMGLLIPTGVAVDANGDLYVADYGNSRVLRFPRPFSQSGMPLRANLVLGQASFVAKLTDATTRTMAAPYALGVTGQGHLMVSDAVHNRVLMFRRPEGGDFSNGMAAAVRFGQPDFFSSAAGVASGGVPAPSNRFNGPRGIALDSSDRLYVCDHGNSRVLIFGPLHTLVDDPFAVATLSGLRNPQGMFVSQATGEIWVADTGNNRALRFPHYDLLPVREYKSEVTISSPGPLALTLDGLGNLLIADGYNRVAIHYPAAVAVNAANFVAATTRPLSPGVIASIFPMSGTLGSETKNFNELPNPVPLPRTLGDIQLLFNDQPAPLYFVSPGQINFLVPMRASTSGNADVVVLQASTGQVLAAGLIPMGVASPSLFTAGATGSGQVAALNQDYSVNSAGSPAGRGEVIMLFGTGQGFVEGAPADGEMASGLTSTSEKPRVWIEGSTDDAGGYVPDANIQYSGLAPGLIGVWQINVKIPERTAPGSRILFVQLKSIASSPPQTRISVK